MVKATPSAHIHQGDSAQDEGQGQRAGGQSNAGGGTAALPPGPAAIHYNCHLTRSETYTRSTPLNYRKLQCGHMEITVTIAVFP